MIIGIMQPYLFPYIGYFQLINAVDQFVIYDDVNYIKNGWINRNSICNEGRKQLITMPIVNMSSNRKINEHERTDYNKKFLRTVSIVYAKAPYRNQGYPLVEEIMSNPEKNLAKFITSSIEAMCRYIGIHTPIMVSSALPKDNLLSGEQRVLNICHLLKGTHYINPIGGNELYSHEAFSLSGLRLNFLQTNTANRFSIIDLIMNHSVVDIQKLLEEYELVI